MELPAFQLQRGGPAPAQANGLGNVALSNSYRPKGATLRHDLGPPPWGFHARLGQAPRPLAWADIVPARMALHAIKYSSKPGVET
jgi:hypothetical protein